MTFIASLFLYFVVLIVVSTPVMFMARRRGRQALIKRFAVGAGIGAVLCALMAAGSRRLISQCEAEGNSNCFDAGGDGMIVTIIIGFAFVSLLFTYFMATD